MVSVGLSLIDGLAFAIRISVGLLIIDGLSFTIRISVGLSISVVLSRIIICAELYECSVSATARAGLACPATSKSDPPNRGES